MKLITRTIEQGSRDEIAKWKVGYLDVAKADARQFLNDEQYAHAVGLIEDLAFEIDPTKSQGQDVGRIFDFWELREKGGVLHKINLRIYFVLLQKEKMILVLAVYKKEDDGQVPSHIVTRVRNRLRIASEQLANDKQKG